jgi:hypothetical protein
MKIRDIVIENNIGLGDSFDIELGNVVIETGIVGFMPDGVIVEADNKAMALLGISGAIFESAGEYDHVEESRMAEVDSIFQSLANGDLDIYTVMNNPQGAEESYVAEKLQDMYDNVSVDYRLNPDDDFEQIIDIMGNQLADDYGTNEMQEAKYQGREVSLGKPMQGDVKKSKVYVRGPKGNVVKVNFGDKKMKIKKSNPKRRKSFRARHNCANPGPRWKARYWSCRAW